MYIEIQSKDNRFTWLIPKRGGLVQGLSFKGYETHIDTVYDVSYVVTNFLIRE